MGRRRLAVEPGLSGMAGTQRLEEGFEPGKAFSSFKY